MSMTEEIVDAYMAAWTEPDETAARRPLERAWSDDGRYVDPMADVSGRAALVAQITAFHLQMPGVRLSRTSAVDEHHGRVRFTWAMHTADGALGMEGVDFCELAADGRLHAVTGFFGAPPVRG